MNTIFKYCKKFVKNSVKILEDESKDKGVKINILSLNFFDGQSSKASSVNDFTV